MLPLLALLVALAVLGSAVALLVTVLKSRSTRGLTHVYLPDPLEGAFLAAGPGRVADTALAVMHVDGRLTTADPGVTHVQRPVAQHPVEQAVLYACGTAPSGSLHWLRTSVMRSPAVQALGDNLARQGLLHRPEESHPAEGWAVLHTWASSRLIPVSFVVTVLQAVFTEGEHIGMPFMVATIPAAAVGWIVGRICVSLTSERLTGGGRAALAQFRMAAQRSGPVHQVACHGPRAVQDRQLRRQLTLAGRPARTGGQVTGAPEPYMFAESTVSWCGGDGGASCGGSSCGSFGGNGGDGGSGGGGDGGSGGGGGE